MRPLTLLAAASAAVLAGTTIGIPAAHAAADPRPTVLATGLTSPLRVAVANARTIYVSQNNNGVITKVTPGKRPVTVFKAKGVEVGALSVSDGTLTFGTTPLSSEPSDRRKPGRKHARHRVPTVHNTKSAAVYRLTPKGKVTKLADIGAFEAANNPDGSVEYGVTDLSSDCAAQWPTDSLGPVTHMGEAFSHPYGSTRIGRTTYLDDAGANDIDAISPSGAVHVVAVLPPSQLTITSELAQGAGAPDCAVGHVLYGEPVPTDIEAHDGMLYVTTLGGGLGEQLPLGALYRIDPKTGATTQLAGGLWAPVGLAVTKGGAAYVSSLFGNEIDKIPAGGGTATKVVTERMPAEVEIFGNRLYATIGAVAPKAKLISLRY